MKPLFSLLPLFALNHLTPKVYFSKNLTVIKKAVNTNQHRNETQSVILLLPHLSMKPDKGKSIQLFWIKEEKLFAQDPKLSCITWNYLKFVFHSFFTIHNSTLNSSFHSSSTSGVHGKMPWSSGKGKDSRPRGCRFESRPRCRDHLSCTFQKHES